MRILLVTNYQPPHPGGIEYAAVSLARAWRRRGHQVTWLTTDIPRGAGQTTSENVRVRALNFWENLFEINSPIVLPTEYGRIRALIHDHDVINIHSLAPGLSTLSLRLAMRARKPLVVTQHVGIIRLRIRALNWLQRMVYVALAQRVVNYGAPLTFVGEAVRQWFIDNARLPSEKLVMTPAGIDADQFYFVSEPERQRFREKWQLRDERLNVLFVGRFYEKKGVPLIREIAGQMPDTQFTLLGSGPVDAEKWNFPNVKVIRYVSTPELRELYGAHDVFIMPSFGEGWPAVVPQAMACGLPCMISEECFSGFNRSREFFLVLPRNAGVWVDQLRTYAKEKLPLRTDWRKAISDFALSTWDWQRTAELYLELFKKARETCARL